MLLAADAATPSADAVGGWRSMMISATEADYKCFVAVCLCNERSVHIVAPYLLLSIYLSICLSVYVYLSLSFYLYLSLCLCLSVSVSLSSLSFGNLVSFLIAASNQQVNLSDYQRPLRSLLLYILQLNIPANNEKYQFSKSLCFT